jgi:hypothetical protein
MIEDQLSHDERVRLECLAQANMTLQGLGGRSSLPPPGATIGDAVLLEAAKYEAFVTGSIAVPTSTTSESAGE